MRNTAASTILLPLLALFTAFHVSSVPASSDGVPDGAEIIRIYFGANRQYIATERRGIFVRDESGTRSLNAPAFARRSSVSTGEYRRITAVAENPKDASHLVIGAQHAIYESRDAGASWKQLSIRGFSDANYITSLMISRSGELFIGTSFGGLYRVRSGAATNISTGLFQQPDTAKKTFVETITALAESPAGELLVGHAFGRGLYIAAAPGKPFTKAPLPISGYDHVSDISAAGEAITIATSSAIYTQSGADYRRETLAADGAPYRLDRKRRLFIDTSPYHKETERPIIKALYYPARKAERTAAAIIRTIKAAGANAVVIDYKDDAGYIYDAAGHVYTRDTGARAACAMKETIAKFKSANIYTIARIVCFKDPRLFSAHNGRFAIRDARSGKPWLGAKSDKWVDPFSEFVREYLIETARAAERAGFDEVQFDYVRFPSDGDIQYCRYSFKENDAFKSEAIADFLEAARKRLRLKISADIYGFNGYYLFGNSIGQDVRIIARYTDAVSPMVYFSHYGPLFYRELPYPDRYMRTVQDSVMRARVNGGFNAAIRPYLQAFPMRSPGWGPAYITNQIRAAEEAAGAGWIFWNAMGDYSVVTKAAAGGTR